VVSSRSRWREAAAISVSQLSELPMPKNNKRSNAKLGYHLSSRVISGQDARTLASSAKVYVGKTTSSKEAARAKLKKLGITEKDGKLAKNYS
jgi:hypothetical protein